MDRKFMSIMPRITISLSKDDEKKLRAIAKENIRTISGQISYWIKYESEIKRASIDIH
jgi:UV DNA damage repair endonuclease